MKTTFQNKYKALEKEVANKIQDLINKKGKESKHRSEKVLKVKDDQQFNLLGGRYLTEISTNDLIDNHGYSYQYHCLTLEQLCEIVDSF